MVNISKMDLGWSRYKKWVEGVFIRMESLVKDMETGKI